MLSVVDTTAGKKLADIKIDGDTLEAMALEKLSPKIYINNKAKNQVDVVDRDRREVIASWPVTNCKRKVATGFDEADHLVSLACCSGQSSVFASQTGKEVTALPMTNRVDRGSGDAGGR